MLGVWWVWAVAAAVLAALEALLPGWVLLGFAIGAAALALALLAGGPLAAMIAGSAPLALLAFALLSLAAWLLLRRIFGVRRGQVKLWDRDINED
jgi:membrane protein implicated in regulation of membrane protease activity